MAERRILVTAALPYTNGHIHIGHLVEYIQTDIWVRFQRLYHGHNVLFLCADDTHGTATMIRARREGRSEEALIAEMREAHLRDFVRFGISFDHYGSTHSEENRRLCESIWKALRDADLIVERDVSQLFDVQAGVFLADRFVKGTCPKCGSPDQYGDNCEKCAATYSPGDLKDPVSTITGTRPEVRSASHLFVQIERLHAFLEEWTQSGRHLQPEVANYLKGHFLGEPLRDWDVSRPAPYFGFEIPDNPGNYWYVWFDAPIGYMASLQQWCAKTGGRFEDWWPRGENAEHSGAEIHHFIGKDITYFHTLFWPAMLKAASFKLPTKVHIHGFLTVGGEKMSKSKGTFVRASTYLDHLDPAYLRYYYASKLTSKLDDLDLNLEEFVNKVNADLVGKVVNLASRTARFVANNGLSPFNVFKGDPPAGITRADTSQFQKNCALADEIAHDYHNLELAAVTRAVMRMADEANKFVELHPPWEKNLADQQRQYCCTIALNVFRQIAVFLAPILPKLAEQTAALLNLPPVSQWKWEDAKTPLPPGLPVNSFQHMLKRVELKQVEAMIAASRESADGAPAAATTAPAADGPEPLSAEPLAPTCSFEEFAKVDMRVARVVAAEDVKESNKLLKLTLSLGGDARRTVFAGIKGVYEPSALVGRLVICCANLAPRKMKFGTSEGMVLAAGPGGNEIYLLAPDSGALPGQRVH
jgi:methionyl-tRNA synthetase